MQQAGEKILFARKEVKINLEKQLRENMFEFEKNDELEKTVIETC